MHDVVDHVVMVVVVHVMHIVVMMMSAVRVVMMYRRRCRRHGIGLLGDGRRWWCRDDRRGRRWRRARACA
jgi:hypothetical protein